jgi:hypothetical protein
MSTIAAPPAAPAKPAAVTPAATPPVTPPAKVAAPVAPATTTPATPPKPAPSLDDGLKALSEKTFAAPVVPPVVEPKVVPPVAAQADVVPPKTDAVIPPGKDPFDHIAAPEGMTEKSLSGWRALKKEASEKVSAAEKRYNDAVAQLDTYKKATPADTAEAARLKAELKETQDRLAVFDLKSHPDFARQYSEPKKAALKEASEIVAYNGKEGVNLAAILDKPLKDFNAEVSELTKDMNGMDATTVQSALRSAYKIANDERGALGKASELKQQLEAKSAQAARQAFDETRTEFTSQVPELQVPEGASEEKIAEITGYNKARADALAEAEQYAFGKMSEKDVARIAQQAAGLKVVAKHIIPSLQRDLSRSNELVKELTAELAAIKKGKSPGAFTDSGGASKPDLSKMPIDQGLKALSKQLLGG